MFCKNCGKEIEDDSKFCPNCGTALNYEVRKQESPLNDNEIVLTLKPRFIWPAVLFVVVPSTLFFSIWCAIFFGGMAQMYFYNHGGVNYAAFIVCGLLPLLTIPPINFFVALQKNKNTIYHFYKTKVEYHEGFLGKDSKTLSYSKVLETELRKGLIQQNFGVGTIYLSAGGVSIAGASAGNGVTIADIPNPDENYKLIKNLIDKYH